MNQASPKDLLVTVTGKSPEIRRMAASQQAIERSIPMAACCRTATVGILDPMSVLCKAFDEHFVLEGIENLQGDVVLEKANPGWSAKTVSKTGVLVQDSALTRGRAVERLLRQSIFDERELAAVMTAVDRALDSCPE